MREPSPGGPGATRSLEILIWPAGVVFAPDAAITFRWAPAAQVKLLRLRGPRTESSPYQVQDPSSPLPWPKDLARIPGSYQWELLARDEGPPLASGRFEILSGSEAAAKRAVYLRKAEGLFPAGQRELGAELLAAEARCFLR